MSNLGFTIKETSTIIPIPLNQGSQNLANSEKTCKDEQNPAWSEEDEVSLRDCISYLETVRINIKDVYDRLNEDQFIDRCINWLNSLKERYTWKPSDEHYELEEFAKIIRGNLTGISNDVQEKFEAKYLQLTGNKMYGGYKD